MKIVLDLDDVLASLVDSWNVWMFDNGYTDRVLSRKDILTYDHYLISGYDSSVFDFYKKYNCYENWVQPIEGSHEFVEWCKQNFDDVMILSYATTKKCQKDKKEFVKRHFDLDHIKFSSSKKEKYTFTKDAILVDDYPNNVLPHVLNNKNHGIVFNRDGENGWSNVLDYKDSLSELSDHDLGKVWTTKTYKDTQILLRNLKENL